MSTPSTHASAATAPRAGPFRVGLTGGIGSGKTVVSDRLAALGAGVIDSDVVARQVSAPGGSAIAPIRDTFGAGFITADGALDRAAMRELVFRDAQARAQLEAITHPRIRAAIDALQDTPAMRAAPYWVFAIPLLVESGQQGADAGGTGPKRFDRILLVDCTVETQLHRVTARSGLETAQIQAIIAAQATRAQRQAVADDIVLNDDLPLAQLHACIDALHDTYVRAARQITRK